MLCFKTAGLQLMSTTLIHFLLFFSFLLFRCLIGYISWILSLLSTLLYTVIVHSKPQCHSFACAFP